MFKLLTEEQKKRIAHEYVLRRAVIILWALVALTIVAMVGFFPSYVLTKTQNQDLSNQLSFEGELVLDEADLELQEWLSSFNAKLKTLAPERDTLRASLLLEKVISLRSPGIKLTSLDWQKLEDKTNLSISGIARDRQALVAFENALTNSGEFGEVRLPLSALSKDKDINFQVTLTASPK